MAAYGLYTHIRSNRRRSVALLIGLFLLVYLMTFAGALVAEAFTDGRASFETIVARAVRDLIGSAPFVTIGTVIWILIAYRFHQSDDRRPHRRTRSDAQASSRVSTISLKTSASRAASRCRS